MTENAGQKQDGRFRPGISGNPPGKPKGTRHKITQLAEKLMQADAENIIVKAVLTAARNGDMQVARLLLDRIAPARRDNPVRFDLPVIGSAAEAASAMGVILSAVADGHITPVEADQVGKVVGTYLRAFETTELDERLRAVEERMNRDKPWHPI